MNHPFIRNKPQRILITGDREWNDISKMVAILSKHIHADCDIIIHGDARGADRMGVEVAQKLGVSKDRILAFPAEWHKYHKAAGPIRNQQMLMEGKPTLVLAFHDHIVKSKGTKDMINISRKAGVPVFLNGVKWI